jgi:hypothetical protein
MESTVLDTRTEGGRGKYHYGENYCGENPPQTTVHHLSLEHACSERVFEKDLNNTGAQQSRVTTQTREKENYHIYI